MPFIPNEIEKESSFLPNAVESSSFVPDERHKFEAGEQPGFIGRTINSIRYIITDKTGFFAPDISSIGGPELDRKSVV